MSRKAWVVAKKLLINGFRYLYHLHSCGFKLKGEQKYLRDTSVKLASWFRTPVSGQEIQDHGTNCNICDKNFESKKDLIDTQEEAAQ